MSLFLFELIQDQKEFSNKTFGEDYSQEQVLNHIKSEIKEIEAEPMNVDEWVDLILLAIDGAQRTNVDPSAIADRIISKLEINKAREWTPSTEGHHQHVDLNEEA